MIRIGIVGCGQIARQFHLPSLAQLQQAEVSALCDTNHVSLKRAAPLSPKARLFESIDGLIKSKSVDVVDICTPGFTHFDLAVKCLESGLDVIVEKPVALSLAATEALDRLCKKSGRDACVMQTLRYHKNVLSMMQLLNRGALGRPRKVACTYHGRNVHNEASWFHDERRSGGIVYELAIHLLDLTALLLGRPETVMGFSAHFVPDLEFTTEITAVVKFENGGKGIVDLAQDTTLHSAMFTQMSLYCSGADAFLKFGPDYLRVTAGQVDPLQEAVAEFRRLANFGFHIITRKYGVHRIEPHKQIISGFLDSIRNGSPNPVTLRSVFNTMRLADLLSSHIHENARVLQQTTSIAQS